ncbi:Ig-like domain-containing protein [Sulfitobacter sp. LCG007]
MSFFARTGFSSYSSSFGGNSRGNDYGWSSKNYSSYGGGKSGGKHDDGKSGGKSDGKGWDGKGWDAKGCDDGDGKGWDGKGWGGNIWDWFFGGCWGDPKWDPKCDPKWDPKCDPKDPPNKEPVPVNDEACVCVGESTVIDLLANDSDPDGDTLSVLSISDDDETVGVGGTLTLASGATATLNADGTVSINASAAAPDLLIGDSMLDEFIYELSDGEATVTGEVDVEINGALNTYDTISSDLGDVGIVTASVSYDNTVGGSLYDVDVQSVEFPDSRLGEVLTNIGNFQLAFCLSIATPISQAPDTNEFTVSILTEDSYTAAIAGAAQLPNSDFGFNPENVDNVNWLLNQAEDLIANGYTEGNIQRAIWNLVDGGADSLLTSNAAKNYFNSQPEFGTLEDARDLTLLALANDGFVAGSGDIVGLILDPVEDGVQPLVIGVEFDLLKENCCCDCGDMIL